MDNLYAIHFGIVPVAGPILVNGHTPADYLGILLESASAHPVAAQVDGTWEEWGEPVEEWTSVHLVVYSLTPDWLAQDEVAQMRESLVRSTTGRVLDYAVVTTHEDWSVKTGIVTLDVGRVYTYTAHAGAPTGDVFTV